MPGLPSGQQAYMSNVRLQKSPWVDGEKPTVGCRQLGPPPRAPHEALRPAALEL